MHGVEHVEWYGVLWECCRVGEDGAVCRCHREVSVLGWYLVVLLCGWVGEMC